MRISKLGLKPKAKSAKPPAPITPIRKCHLEIQLPRGGSIIESEGNSSGDRYWFHVQGRFSSGPTYMSLEELEETARRISSFCMAVRSTPKEV